MTDTPNNPAPNAAPAAWMKEHPTARTVLDALAVIGLGLGLLGLSHLYAMGQQMLPVAHRHLLELAILLAIPLELACLFWLTMRVVVLINLKPPPINDYGMIRYTPRSLALRAGITLGGAVVLVIIIKAAAWLLH